MIFKSNIFFHHIEILNTLWNLTGKFDNTALIHASFKGYTEIVEILLKQEDIDVNIRGIFD